MYKLTCLISLLLGVFSFSTPSYAIEPSDTVARYIEALKNGNVYELKTILGGSLYTSRRVLLEENTEYPQFLRKRFQQAQITLEGSPEDLGNNKKGLHIKMLFPDGSTNVTKLVLEQTSTGTWKIIQELQ